MQNGFLPGTANGRQLEDDSTTDGAAFAALNGSAIEVTRRVKKQRRP
jgi:hypothetical protein